MSLPFPALRGNCSDWAASMCSLPARTKTRRKSSTRSTARKAWYARTAGKDCREVITDRVARMRQRPRGRSPTVSSGPRRCAKPRNIRGKRSTRGFARAWVNTYRTGFSGHGKWMSQAQAKPERWVVSDSGFRGLYAVTPDEPDIGSLTRKVSKALAGGARIVQYRNKFASARCVLRSEEHTSELQSRQYLVCRLLLEKKKK